MAFNSHGVKMSKNAQINLASVSSQRDVDYVVVYCISLGSDTDLAAMSSRVMSSVNTEHCSAYRLLLHVKEITSPITIKVQK